MITGESIRRGTAWLVIGKTAGKLLGFAFGIVLARLLAPEDFGALITISVFTGIAGLVAGGGMGQALVRAETATKQDFDIVFTLQCIICLIIYGFFFLIAPWFAAWYDNPMYADLMRLAATSFLVRPFVSLPTNILTRHMQFKSQAWIGLTTMTVSNGTCIVLAALDFKVWSLVIGGIVGSLVNAMLLSHAAKWRPGISREFGRGKELARYGFMVTATDFLVYIRMQVTPFILSRTMGPASLGLYNKGDSLAQLPNAFITGSLYQVLLRAIAAEQNDLGKCRYLFFRGVMLVSVYTMPFYIGLLWLAEPMVRGLYGAQWVAAAEPLWILVFAWPFWVMESLSGAVLAARNWLQHEVPVQLATIVVILLAVVIGLNYGLKGVAYAIVGGTAFSAIYLHWVTTRCLESRWYSYLKALAPAMILNAILAVSLFAITAILPASWQKIDLLYCLILGTSGGLIYLAAFLYLPIAALKDEQQQWKKKLGIGR